MLIGCGKWSRATEALSRCDYDRARHPGLLAMECLNQACAELGSRRYRESLSLFAESRAICESLKRWHDAARVTLYTVEAHVGLNDRLLAIRSCTEALGAFQKAGCDHKTEEALTRLGELLTSATVDLAAVTACVRELALKHGGYLPLPSAQA
jgi:hypothetical protein